METKIERFRAGVVTEVSVVNDCVALPNGSGIFLPLLGSSPESGACSKDEEFA